MAWLPEESKDGIGSMGSVMFQHSIPYYPPISCESESPQHSSQGRSALVMSSPGFHRNSTIR